MGPTGLPCGQAAPGPASALGTGVPPDAPVMLVHLQIRPRWASVGRAMAQLNALVEGHPAVAVTVCGVSRDAKYLRVTLSVDLGPVGTIARFSAEASAAYAFVGELFERMFDHAPCYVGGPTEQERLAAVELVTGPEQRVRLAWRGAPDPEFLLSTAPAVA